MRLIDLDAPQRMPIDIGVRVEVRTYPNFGEYGHDISCPHTTAIYRIGALCFSARGTYALALERETEDGRTEVVRMRLLREEER